MNYSHCSFACGPCNNQPMPACPVRQNCRLPCDRIQVRQIDPLFPAGLSTRPQVKKTPNPKLITKKQPAKPLNKKKCPKETSLESLKCLNNSSTLNEFQHPCDCACPECDKCIEALKNKDNNQDITQISYCDLEMTNPRSDRNMKNYLHDNPDLVDAKYTKSSCSEIFECLGSNSEVWVLQCPKGFDPNEIMNTEIGKLQKDKNCKVDFTAKRFKDKISLACLTPQKAAEYEIICDRIQMLKPVGKITISETKVNLSRKSSKADVARNSESCSETENIDEDINQPQNPIASKVIKKKFNDQKFTIETTVTVENCGDRKNRKIKQEMREDCLPLIPPEPVVPAKKQKKKIKEEDLSWLDC